MKKIMVLTMICLVLVSCGKEDAKESIDSFEECVGAGNPVMKSYPAQCSADGKIFVEETGRELKCEAAGGTWLEAYEECNGIGKEACEEIGGFYAECESPCRHDPDAEMCVAMCEQVCYLKEIVGGDSDVHGCKASAGYSWCEAQQKCLRAWEEPCDTTVTTEYGFLDCVAEGNPVMESYPRQCTAQGITYTEVIGDEGVNEGAEAGRHVCTEEESLATMCTMEYAPVCGEIVLNMGKTVYQTFGNGCGACASMKTVAYTPGECEDETTDICYDGEGNFLALNEAAAIARESECGDDLILECVCPDGYNKEGTICNPKCYDSVPACMSPSIDCPDPVICNTGTGTYWIELSTKKEGCSPACVVDVKTRQAEINWRCTGVMSEPGSAGE